MDDVASGAYHFLSGLPDVLSVIGSFPADDPDNAGVPWIFVRNIAQRMEGISVVKSSQAVSLVLANAGQAGAPLDTSSVRWQRLEVDIWVDPLRDYLGNVTSPSETEARMQNVFAVLDAHLHRVAVGENTQMWGELVTVSSTRMTEPQPYLVPDGDGLLRGVAYYMVGCFGWNVSTVGSGDSGSGTGTA